ncbi:phosphohydrolase [Desulfomarina profundi]|uniref:Phosphohydrolase n=1 Tax=Desulfomarina profundi TaxID=2772557 RepID=A0A8D5FP35_9BACT|nr:HDOD domain-containing protein [Desulfomarina profundi]BCL62678.1 phosphohydrolase [Desulfomarina profundi]
MPLKLFQKIRNHAAIATGNFNILFKDIEITPLPAASARLLEEINRTEVDMEQISRLISAMPEVSAQVIKTVNSSLFSLRSPVLSIQHAVSLLGLDHIRSITLSFAAVNSVPRPQNALFNHQAFWSDSLVRALIARGFARYHCPEECDDAFTAMLIADVALPILLGSWTEYYEPVVQKWLESDERLSEIEQHHFGWNHAQAGAWILQHWKFPEQLICFVGIHNANPDCIEELQLENSIALPLMTASILPSSLHPENGKTTAFISEAVQRFNLNGDELAQLLQEAEHGFLEIHELLGLCHVGEQPTLKAVKKALTDLEK